MPNMKRTPDEFETFEEFKEYLVERSLELKRERETLWRTAIANSALQCAARYKEKLENDPGFFSRHKAAQAADPAVAGPSNAAPADAPAAAGRSLKRASTVGDLFELTAEDYEEQRQRCKALGNCDSSSSDSSDSSSSDSSDSSSSDSSDSSSDSDSSDSDTSSSSSSDSDSDSSSSSDSDSDSSSSSDSESDRDDDDGASSEDSVMVRLPVKRLRLG